MASWNEFHLARPEMAEEGHRLLYQFGVGLAFLGTVRPDGGPRVHPICPILATTGLYAFLIPSPKRNDLLRDDRYTLHSFPADDNEDAFSVTGTAVPRDTGAARGPLLRQFLEERPSLDPATAGLEQYLLFEFDLNGCLLTQTTGHGDPGPVHTVWHAHAEQD
jgi:hypothetical protein